MGGQTGGGRGHRWFSRRAVARAPPSLCLALAPPSGRPSQAELWEPESSMQTPVPEGVHRRVTRDSLSGMSEFQTLGAHEAGAEPARDREGRSAGGGGSFPSFETGPWVALSLIAPSESECDIPAGSSQENKTLTQPPSGAARCPRCHPQSSRGGHLRDDLCWDARSHSPRPWKGTQGLPYTNKSVHSHGGGQRDPRIAAGPEQPAGPAAPHPAPPPPRRTATSKGTRERHRNRAPCLPRAPRSPSSPPFQAPPLRGARAVCGGRPSSNERSTPPSACVEFFPRLPKDPPLSCTTWSPASRSVPSAPCCIRVTDLPSQVRDFQGGGQGGGRATSPQRAAVSRGPPAPAVAGPLSPSPVSSELGASLLHAGADPRLLLARPLAVTLRLPSWVMGPPHRHGVGVPAPRAPVTLLSAVTCTRLHLTLCSVPVPLRCVCRGGGGRGRGRASLVTRLGLVCSWGLKYTRQKSRLTPTSHRSCPLPS